MSGQFAIKLLGVEDVDLVLSAEGLFDFPCIPDQTRAFLTSERDFLWFALDSGQPVGFVSASVILHPDKAPHLFVNELATHSDHRRRGIARALMGAVIEFGRARKFWPVWLAAEGHDEPAIEFYRSLEHREERDAVVFEWEKS
ncbi:MAG: GNAT family N-acetyltransferase [Sphingomonadaceae bacterium]|nr:GNAT family N-acetyltransferase [Sphingomonadaceae bacterium]